MTVGEKDVLPRCFFDVEIGGVGVGRVVFELFSNLCPKTCENFRQLCTGEGGVGKTTGKPLHYKGTVFHRVIKDFMIQGGDFSNFNGTGGESIYGGTFEDEYLQGKHDEPYLLSMANRGTNTNGSQFFVLTSAAPHLNGIHVVFGRVVSGQPIIKQIEGLPVDRKSRPLSDVKIANCGELVLLKKKKENKQIKNKIDNDDIAEDEENKSSGEVSESDSDTTEKKRKKRSNRAASDDENLEVLHPLASIRNIDPETIPKDPSNRYLNRNRAQEDNSDEKGKEKLEKDKSKSKHEKTRSKSKSQSRSRSKSMDRDRGRRSGRDDRSRFGASGRATDNEGRKIKGRGRICFPRFTSRSRSKTPPHWKAETRKTISMREFESREKRKKDRDDELHRRQEERRKRHEENSRRVPDREPEKERERTRREREHVSSSVRISRFHSAAVESEDEILEPEPKSKTIDSAESSKIVEELSSKLQAAGDGVVYYQHLYKTPLPLPTLPVMDELGQQQVETRVESKENSPVMLKQKDISQSGDEEEEDEGPPGEEDEDVLAELRLRRELLKKRLKDWEESSNEGERGENENQSEANHDKKADNGGEDKELKSLTQQQETISTKTNTIENLPKDHRHHHEKKTRNRSKSKPKSRSRSKSKHRSRSKSKDRREKRRDRRHRSRSRSSHRRRSSRDRGHSNRRSDFHDRDRGNRRDTSKSRERDRDRRSKRSKSRSKSPRSRDRDHRRR